MHILQAQSLRYSIALPYISLSAYSEQQQDPFSFTGNQAALAQTKQAGVAIYSERRFLLAPINSYAAVAAIPSRMGNMGIQVNYSGFKDFNENKIGLAYGKSLGKKIDVGIQFDYYSYHIPAYQNASAVSFEAAMLLHFSDKFRGGIQVYNPVGGKLGKGGGEKLASAYSFGLGYDASPDFFVSIAIIKEEDKPINVIGGFQYRFEDRFFLRAGILSESSSAFAGAGIGWKNMRLDISGSYHPQLGFTPGILLATNFGNTKSESHQ